MAESKYSLRLAAVDAYSKTFGDFGKKADELQEQVKAQRAELDKLNRTARDADGYAKLTEKVEKTTASLQLARAEQSRIGREHQAATAKVERLSQEYGQASATLQALEASTEATTAQVKTARAEHARLGRELNAATAEVKKLDGAQDRNTASVRTLEAAQRSERNELKRLQTELTGAGVDTSKLASEQKRLEAATEQANAALQAQRARLDAVRTAQGRVDANRGARADLRGQLVETAAVAYLAAKPVSQAMDLETAMADVAKVVTFEEGQREAMASANLKMASDRLISSAGITAVDLAKIQYAAGQSGIGNDAKDSAGKQAAIVEFTRDAAIMGAAFDLDAQTAGETMAGWRASMNLDRQGTLDLADATNYLGNSFNATPADIAAVVKRYGAVGTASGLSPEQTAALSAAFLNPGTEKEIAGTGFKNFTAALTKGKAATKGQRETWEELGFDPEELAAGMQQDAPKVIMDVLQALKQAPEEEQSALATQLFGSESIGAIMPLLQNLGEVEKAFGMVANKADAAGSMMKEAAGVSETSRAGWNAFTAKLTRLSTTVGTAMLPALDAVLVPLGALVDLVSDAADAYPPVTAAIAVLGGGLAALKVGALGLKFAGLMAGQAFNRAGLARAKLDANTARTALTADRAVLRLNAAMARLGAGGAAGGLGAGKGGKSRKGGKGGKGGRTGGAGKSGSLGATLADASSMAGRFAAPLMLLSGVMDAFSLVSEGADASAIGESVGGTAGGLGGLWGGAAAGAAIGSVVPGIGTAAGGLVGGAVGAFAGTEAGSWLGEKLGALVDRLSSPEAVAKEVVNNTDSRQISFAPVIHIAGADQATSSALADQVIAKMRGEFTPLMMANPLAVRRGAALTDGSD
ncbi:phage tail tape measure protein [Pseudomonas kunmingensis]|uniref:phage tail tape measure protein n=1 Tax=Stutzerimonas kunmingensis TaxID=1211807 RepID=UPI0017479439|nr:phage tail tape measure protein [Stutzerimonas kunmingensis]MBD3877426.1 phage tail tape measure protein [Stutzerimonas kunmingensis]